MIPRQCKRLAEVDFPIAAVSRHAVREKSIRHGHPSTLHLWWARRPLASSRAVLLALLLPDPCDPHCPGAFKEAASKLLPTVGGGHTKSDNDLRRGLLKFIADFANWDNAANSTFLGVGRSLVKAAHGEEAPLVVDPFAGGGSIPLEALRLGCEAFASDLNPVACLILKVMLEDIPRHGTELVDELREAGAEIKRRAERELADLYPVDPDGATPIAYLWARTVRCEAPDCGAEIPLMRSFWLCKKAKRKRALRHSVERVDGAPPKVLFEVFEPKTEREVRAGTVTRAKATCLCCGAVLPPERVRLQLAAERGGADAKFDADGTRIGGARMTAVVTLRPNKKGRHYRLPSDADYAAVRQAQTRVSSLLEEWERGGKQGLCPVPDEPLPPIGTLGFRVQRYGMLQWGDLFTARQKVALFTLTKLIKLAAANSQSTDLFSAALSRCADHWSSGAMWIQDLEAVAHTFGRQALPIVWDFTEACGFAGGGATWEGQARWVAKVVETTKTPRTGVVQLSDATKHPLPDESGEIWFTDPPYYDAVPYADLSDYFFVWLKRALPEGRLLQDPFDGGNPLSPKEREAVQDETKSIGGRSKNRNWFEEKMSEAFVEGRRILSQDGIGSVVFAHKTTEGWEALLSGMIRGGWTITGSWPIATERSARMRARNSAALATSVHLICRPRSEDAPIGEWADVLRELPLRVADWMEHLQQEGVRGADLVFACIGPALEIFSRYRAVETAEGKQVGLPDYLEKVWEVVGRAALEQVLGMAEASARNGMAGALEEDARLTALFLWALQSTEEQGRDRQTYEAQPNDGGHSMIRDAPASTEPGDAQEEAVAKATAKGFHLPFDVVRRFSQPMGIDLDHWQGRVIAQEKGVVRLLPVAERAEALFGADGTGSATLWIESGADASGQESLFPELGAGPQASAEKRAGGQVSADAVLESPDATALDRVHAAMLLQSGGHANALRTLILAEQERAPDFLRLSNALSALYPRGSREKRLLDAMLLAVPR
ncbi:MAG: DUF1156 domain-containing protein [Gammaproteobacteria bacterium]|nr:DUF1156 domain-containing protein [Gammaproteobacteria bacterium]MCY4255933.1 DUF1156 domain-containing protein [Gammaproteobacteria bacterium]